MTIFRCDACSGNTCTSCEHDKGYYLSGEICCNTNDNGLFPDTEGGCQECSSLIPECWRCKYDLEGEKVACESCQQGTYLQDDACPPCEDIFPGCSDCLIIGEGVQICIACKPGFQLTSQSDQCCDESSGYYASTDNQCKLCQSTIQGCGKCKLNMEALQCSSCLTEDGYITSGDVCCSSNEQYFPDGNGGCEMCGTAIPGCSQCSYSSSLRCSVCNQDEGYTSDGNGACTQCPVGCTACSASECSSCAAGFQLSGSTCCNTQLQQFPDGGNSCQSCSSLFPSCQLCAWDDSLICTSCTSILSGCAKCSSPDICIQCDADFHLQDSQCRVCDELIPECDSCSVTGTCSRCKQGYALVSPSSCQPCGEGQVVGVDGDRCVSCSSVEENCEKCSDANTCSACSKGFILTPDHKCQICGESSTPNNAADTCVPCSTIDENCLTCSDESTCSSCADGFTVRDGKCFSCSEGLFWDGSKCSSCPAFCQACSSHTTCTQCALGFTAQNGVCTRCMNGLTDCSSDRTAFSCQDGFYSQSGKCHLCPSNCYLCSDSFTCSVCSPGYSLHGSKCQECSGEGCEKCVSGLFSIIDQQGKKVGDCEACSQDHHCAECRATADQCTACHEGYQFLGFTCVRQTRVSFLLTLQIQMAEFLTRVQQFRAAFLHALDDPNYENREELLHFMSLAEGSTVIDAQLEVFPATSQAIYKKLQDFSTTISGFTITSLSNLTPINFQKPVNEIPNNSNEQEFPVFAILLLAIIPIIVVAAVVYFVVVRNAKEGGDEEIATQSATESSKPTATHIKGPQVLETEM